MNMLAMYPLGIVGPWQIVIIALVIILLFGGKKIPELMRGLGQGVKSFKKGMQEIENEMNSEPVKTSDKIKDAKEVEAKKEDSE